MKAPSVFDITIVVVVMTGMQAIFATIPESQLWWAPAASAGLLAALKAIQVYWPKPEASGPTPASMSAPSDYEPEDTKFKQWLVD